MSYRGRKGRPGGKRKLSELDKLRIKLVSHKLEDKKAATRKVHIPSPIHHLTSTNYRSSEQ